MALFAVVLGFTSCSNDKDPVFQKPTNFVLNTPALANQYYELTPEGSLVFTVSQPDYGFTASCTYGLQIALKENPSAEDIYNVSATNPTSATIRVNAADVATGMCVLRGISKEEEWVEIPAAPLYVRATSILGSHENSFIASNWVTLKQVKGYFAVPQPGIIYLVGKPEGWKGPDEANADHYADWILSEKDNEIGSKVYYGLFDIKADEAMFRFYTALTGWEDDSYGTQEDDDPMAFPDLGDTKTQLTEKLVKGKGAFNFPNWPGGQMTIIVDMSNPEKMTATFIEGNQL